MRIESIRFKLEILIQSLMSLKFLIVFESLIEIVDWSEIKFFSRKNFNWFIVAA
jgi:hypothetical protein